VRHARLALAAYLVLATSCARGPGEAGDSVPRGRLPSGARPQHYSLELEIIPERERFAGTADIRLEIERATETLWLHGRDLTVDAVRVQDQNGEPLRARWQVADESGVVALRLPRAVGPGVVSVRITYGAPFSATLRGLYRTEAAGEAYAFTQFEPIAARRAFPGFDEPRFRAPFDVTLTVRQEHQVIASTPAVQEEILDGGLKRVRFATTPPLPTYLLAWAVGPLEIVEAPPIPASGPRARSLAFRGAAVRGRGAELAYALERTPPLLEALESYFGSEYPFAKLDVIAVPDFGAGAMENVGAITFRESLLLIDEDGAPEWQRRAFASVMAHELAHQWFGNLVTLAWWDDIWLNEAFATWMAARAVQAVHPEHQPGLRHLARVLGAMDADSLVSARQIRQPIQSNHDIRNAFDAITYSKGGGVLSMFERWIGHEGFRQGIRDYLDEHRFGVATSSDLLSALSRAAGRDVETPFRTFLDQPGVPYVEAALRCGKGRASLDLRQARYLPVGSSGSRDAVWQVPVCARYAAARGSGEACTLLSDVEGTLALVGVTCPDWALPNADGAGYYRWSLAPPDAAHLRRDGMPRLSARERLSFAIGLDAAFRAGALPASDVFAALASLADDPARPVAEAPMSLLRLAREHLVDATERPQVEAFAASLYLPTYRRLGWVPERDEDGEARLLRGSVIGFLADVAVDTDARHEAAARGRRYAGIGAGGILDPDAVDPELVATALRVAVQDGGAPVFDALLAHLDTSDDAVLRRNVLEALGSTRDPALAARARNLALDESVRINETRLPLDAQMLEPRMRVAAWDWIEANFDALVGRVGPDRAGRLVELAAYFCDAASARRVKAFLSPQIDELGGGPRSLSKTLERIRLCAALVEAQGASTRAFFAPPVRAAR
jgi:alanyl aminopeptidase